MKRREEFLKEGYTNEEVDIIEKLEEYASQIDCIIQFNKQLTTVITTLDFVEFITYIEEIQKLNINEKIKSYSEYLHGAAIPLYSKTVKETDYKVEPELTLIEESKDWVSLIKTVEEKEIDLPELIQRIQMNVCNDLINYFEVSNWKWALMMGYHHYWAIMNNKCDKIEKFK
jgi:hypothetical protein